MTPNRILIWPATPAGIAERDAYAQWSDTAAPVAYQPVQPDWWAMRFDVFGQPFCAMCEYRPDYEEPEGGPALRPNAVMLESPPQMPPMDQ